MTKSPVDKLLRVHLYLDISSDLARNHLRHMYRECRRIGTSRFDSRLLLFEAATACRAEADQAFHGGILAEYRAARRMAS